MGSCMFNCLKYTFGFWGAVAILGLIVAGVATAIAASGGAAAAGLAGFIEVMLASAVATAGLKAALAGAGGMLASLIGCLISCASLNP